MMPLSVFGWETLKKCLKRRGEFALAVIADGLCDFGYAHS